MRVVVSIVWAMFAVACSIGTHAGGDNTLSCSNDGTGSVLTLGGAGHKIVVAGADVCRTGFEFIPDKKSATAGIIILSPEHLGLRSKSAVYRASFVSGVIRLIGELPASAQAREDGTYVEIYQEGGSIYLERYLIHDDQIERSPSSLELVVDGEFCISPTALVESAEVGSCRSAIVATFEEPICVQHSSDSSRMVSRATCGELEELVRHK